MARIAPRSAADVPDLAPVLELVEQAMGFVPNSMLTMARVPGLTQALAALAGAVQGPGRVDPALKQLVAVMASRGAECRYCQAHTAHQARERRGVSREKLDALWSFETDAAFSDAERAALRLAFAAGQVPNAAEDAHFEALRAHFDDDAIAEIVAVIALFGFLNRWNDTLATELESAPLAFARDELAADGWSAGKHGPEGP